MTLPIGVTERDLLTRESGEVLLREERRERELPLPFPLPSAASSLQGRTLVPLFADPLGAGDESFNPFACDADPEEQRSEKFPDGSCYEGGWMRGVMHGKGVMDFANGDRYEGEWRGGTEHGKGTILFANGDRYEGEWYKGVRQGRGVMHFATGARYEGEWRGGAPDGMGEKRFAGGDRYEGSWKQGVVHGKGKLRFSNGDRYEGEWSQGLLHGKGKVFLVSGAWYEGEWDTGKRHGKGEMCFPNGDRYKGDWHQGKRDGKGVMRFASGDRYEGDWAEGNFHGRGTMFYADGDRYEGCWREGVRHGNGKMLFHDGSRYEGEWEAGVQHGRGEALFSSGSWYVGDWQRALWHGQGVHFLENKLRYEGEFEENEMHGRGALISLTGERCEGVWKYGNFVMTPEIASTRWMRKDFIESLLAQGDHLLLFGTCGGIGLSVLLEMFQDPALRLYDDPEIASRIEMLKKASELSRMSTNEVFQEIQNALNCGQPILYPYASIDHVMGLELKKVGREIEIRVFNSGHGLRPHHRQHGAYFETQWVVTVPDHENSRRAIQQLIDQRHKGDPKDLYEQLLKIPHALKKDVYPSILQKPQAGMNCFVEWAFAYLKNSLPEAQYHRLRLNLFEKCLEYADTEEVKRALQKKVDKRRQKMQEASASALQAPVHKARRVR